MGFLVSLFFVMIAVMGFQSGSLVGGCLALVVATLTAPPLWKHLKAKDIDTRPFARWTGAIVLGFLAMGLSGNAYSETPAGKASAERRAAAEERQQAMEAELAAELAESEEARRGAERASGEHCLNGWDGSFPRLIDAVEENLRNPRSFEHIETARGPVHEDGTFALVMRYRAENGFGGMNADSIAVIVNADDCQFRTAGQNELEARATR